MTHAIFLENIVVNLPKEYNASKKLKGIMHINFKSNFEFENWIFYHILTCFLLAKKNKRNNVYFSSYVCSI